MRNLVGGVFLCIVRLFPRHGRADTSAMRRYIGALILTAIILWRFWRRWRLRRRRVRRRREAEEARRLSIENRRREEAEAARFSSSELGVGVGLDPRAWEHLQTFTVETRPQGAYYAIDLCSICRELLGRRVTRLPCRHEFHSGCIEGWFLHSSVCPLCKDDLNNALGVI